MKTECCISFLSITIVNVLYNKTDGKCYVLRLLYKNLEAYTSEILQDNIISFELDGWKYTNQLTR